MLKIGLLGCLVNAELSQSKKSCKGCAVILIKLYLSCFCTKASVSSMKKQLETKCFPHLCMVPNISYVSLVRVFLRDMYICFLNSSSRCFFTPAPLTLFISFASAVKLPELLFHVNIEEETLTELQQNLVDFLRYLEIPPLNLYILRYQVSVLSFPGLVLVSLFKHK